MNSLNEFPLLCMRIKGMTDVSLYAQGKGQELFLFNDFYLHHWLQIILAGCLRWGIFHSLVTAYSIFEFVLKTIGSWSSGNSDKHTSKIGPPIVIQSWSVRHIIVHLSKDLFFSASFERADNAPIFQHQRHYHWIPLFCIF